MTIENNVFVYKLFDKRDKFPISTLYVCLICPAIFYHPYSMVQEFLQIARYTLRMTDFVPKSYQLCTRMITQGENNAIILLQIKQPFQRYPETKCFQVLRIRHMTN